MLPAERGSEPRIYLDNAATSWPKPPSVVEAVERYMRQCGAPAGRSSYHEAIEVARQVDDLRHQLLAWLGTTPDRYGVAFAYSGTDALNTVLRGLLRPGDHVVTTAADHNSVLRPLNYLARTREVQVITVPVLASGQLDLDAMQQSLRQPTRLVALTHVSNVTGVAQPVAEVLNMAHAAGARVLLDAAQSLGHLPLSLAQLPVDALAAPGHKGLLGPLGTGVIVVARDMMLEIEPLRLGGTGSRSESPEQPSEWPDRFEAGNANVPGLVGLAAGLAVVRQRGVEAIAAADHELALRLIAGLASVPGVTLHAADPNVPRAGVVSFTVAGVDPQEAAAMLESAAGIQVRAGLHCAPLMHRALGTLESGGTVRASVGPFTTSSEIDTLVRAVQWLAESVA